MFLVLIKILYYSYNSVSHLKQINLNNKNLLCFCTLHFVRSIDLYNRDLQTTIILFTRNLSSHKTDWILSELLLPAISCLLYHWLNSLMKTFEGECLCLRKITLNVKKLPAVLLLPVYLFIRFFILHFVCCLLPSLSPFFILLLM